MTELRELHIAVRAGAVALASCALACGAGSSGAGESPRATAAASATAPSSRPVPSDSCSRACEAGVVAACWEAVERAKQAGASSEALRALAEHACARGEARACAATGFSAETPPAVAAAALERACRLGSGVACARRIVKAAEGEQPPLKADAERSLAERACELEQGPSGCERLVQIYENEGRDPDLVTMTHVRACVALDTDSCRRISARAPGRDVWQVMGPAAATACKAGGAWGCVLVAQHEVAAQAARPTAEAAAVRARALAETERACSTGFRGGCLTHAMLLARGVGAAADRPAAIRELAKHCVEGYEPACNLLEEWHVEKPTACAAPPG